ncbi:MAG: glycosyltransferase family 9 protein [Thermodesulfobacteriota bacterium]
MVPPATLALHLGALGDFVLSWPALGLLAADPPGAALHLWGRPDWAGLILPPEQVHDREAACFAGLFSLQPDPALDRWLTGFGRAVVFAAAPPPELPAHLEQVVPQVWCLSTRPPAGKRLHVADWQVGQLRKRGLGGPTQPLPVRLELPAGGQGAVLAPGSGGRAKRLSPDLAATLARRLRAEGHQLTLLLGPAEEPAYARALQEELRGVDYALVREPAIPELARRLAGADLYLGADSGVSHLAAALGAPCLVVFQASDPRVWGPRGPRARVVISWEAAYVDLAPPRARV